MAQPQSLTITVPDLARMARLITEIAAKTGLPIPSVRMGHGGWIAGLGSANSGKQVSARIPGQGQL